MNPFKPPVTICIIGNIGSGKSTLTEFLAAAVPKSVAVPEQFDDNPFLALYVANPPRWGFTNAVRYFYDYARLYRDVTAGREFEHCFIDAGGATNRYIYGRYLVQEGIVTPEEDAFHQLLCDLIANTFGYPDPDAYIFVHAAPEACFERMKARGWKYQTEHIALTYLQNIQKYFAALREQVQAQHIPLLDLDSAALNFTTPDGKIETLRRVLTFLS